MYSKDCLEAVKKTRLNFTVKLFAHIKNVGAPQPAGKKEHCNAMVPAPMLVKISQPRKWRRSMKRAG